MGLLIMGKLMLIGFMMMVMSMPFFYYLKRDRAYETAKEQSEKVRLNIWYNR